MRVLRRRTRHVVQVARRALALSTVHALLPPPRGPPPSRIDPHGLRLLNALLRIPDAGLARHAQQLDRALAPRLRSRHVVVVVARALGLGAPGAHGVGAAFVPRLGERGEVLAVGGPGDEDAEEAAGDDVEGVVPRVHDAGGGDEGGAEGGDEDDEGLPHLAAAVEDVELAGEVEREVEEAGE